MNGIVGLRRVCLPPLDRVLGRCVSTITNKTNVDRLFISRVDTTMQWVVVSNPSEQTIDLTGYSLCNNSMTKCFPFPQGYELPVGEEVKVWCCPGDPLCETNKLYNSFLLWRSNKNGSLNRRHFFDRADQTIILVDQCGIEVASLTIEDDKTITYSFIESGIYKQWIGYYVFTRYWAFVSGDAGNSRAFIVVSIIETYRMIMILRIFTLDSMASAEDLLHALLMSLITDVTARICSRNIKHGANLLQGFSLTLDYLAGFGTYNILHSLFKTHTNMFSYLQGMEVACVATKLLSNLAVNYRWCTYSSMERYFQRRYYEFPMAAAVVNLASEVLLILLIMLALNVLPMGVSFTWLQLTAALLVPLSVCRIVFIVLHIAGSVFTLSTTSTTWTTKHVPVEKNRS